MKTIAAGLALVSLLQAGAAQANPSQLVAHLGLTSEQAATLSLSEIAALKFNQDSDADDRQSVIKAAPAAATNAFLPAWQDGDDH